MHIDTLVFKELHDEWFCNKSYWFEKVRDNDIYLSEKYFGIVENKFDLEIDLKNNTHKNLKNLNIRGQIIQLNQEF